MTDSTKARADLASLLGTATLIVVVAVGCARPTPDLPSSLPATMTDQTLAVRFGVLDVWQVRHPDYPDPLKVLVAQKMQRGFVDYQIGFYRLEDDTFTRIGQPMTIGGYERPILGTHPELQLPAVVATAEHGHDVTFIFLSGGAIQSRSADEEAWRPASEVSSELNSLRSKMRSE